MRYPMPHFVALLIAAAVLAVDNRPLSAQGVFPNAGSATQPAPSPDAATVAQRRWFSLPKLPWSKKDKHPAATKASEHSARKAPSAANSKLDAQAAFARLNERRGQPGLAEAIYRELLEKEPGMSLPNHRLGVMEAKKGNFEVANSHFQAALEGDADNQELLVDAGYCLYLQNRLDEAEELYRRAFQINPDNQALCNNLGLLLGEQKRFEEALMIFKRGGSSAAAHANLGFVMAQLGEMELAERNFHAALDQDPSLRSAAVALVQIDSFKRSQAVEASLTGNVEQRTDLPPTTGPAMLEAPPSAAIPSAQMADVSNGTTRPTAVANATFQQPSVPSTSLRSDAQSTVADDQVRPANVSMTNFGDGRSNPQATTVADIVVGGQKVIGDMNDPYQIRYAGAAITADNPRTSAPIAPEPTGRTERRSLRGTSGLTTRPESGSVVVGDVQASAPRGPNSGLPPKPAFSDPTVLPTAQDLAPPVIQLPQASAPSPMTPVSGSHYNLNPHAQVWASPPTIQTGQSPNGPPYPTTPYGGSPPPQTLPTAPNSSSIYRR